MARPTAAAVVRVNLAGIAGEYPRLDVHELVFAVRRHLGLTLVKHPVGEGVLAGGVRGVGGGQQVLAADHAVLVVTEEGLDRLGSPIGIN